MNNESSKRKGNARVCVCVSRCTYHKVYNNREDGNRDDAERNQVTQDFGHEVG